MDHRTTPGLLTALILLTLIAASTGCGPSVRPQRLPLSEQLPPYRISIQANETLLTDELHTLIVMPGEFLRLRSEISGGRFALLRWMTPSEPEAEVEVEGNDIMVVRRPVDRTADHVSLTRLVEADFDWDATGGRFITDGDHWYRFWQAPERHGTYRLSLKVDFDWEFKEYMEGPKGRKVLKEERRRDAASLELLVLVSLPQSKLEEGQLFGYPIGTYPDPSASSAADIALFSRYYQPPSGFIEVRRSEAKLKISEHFRLGDFLCPEPSGFPRYIALDLRLPALLERVVDRLSPATGAARVLRVISGFRSPAFNEELGMDPFSRHQYGDAADIIVDGDPEDWIMDDLTGDGNIDHEDAQLLGRWIAESRESSGITGGTGVYSWSGDGRRGPFVHVDCRGYNVSWEGTADGE